MRYEEWDPRQRPCSVCSSTDYELRQKRCSNGATQYKFQCLVCGTGSEAVKVDSIPQYGLDTSGFWDEGLSARYFQGQIDMGHKDWEAQRTERRQKFFQDYDAYRETQEWKDRREAVLLRDGGVCQACGRTGATQVHHLTYDHYKHEPLFDLVSIHKECHEEVTRMDRQRRGEVA